MTPISKAIDILEKINNGEISESEWKECSEYQRRNLKRKALVVVGEVQSSLISYGEDSMELQNMESHLRYWEKVKVEIKIF
jgi:hypothetical protein